jgi:pimeloyl-ACP methyl ester carboxylesterase
MIAAEEIVLRTANTQFAAKAWGPVDGLPVLALHGWLDNAASFDTLAPLLPGARVVALDLPGHGRTSHRAPGAWYHYVDYLDEVLAAADVLGWTRFVLLGHSLGGAIGSILAAVVPERVAQLWLVEALGPMATPAGKMLGLLRQAIADRAGLATKSLRVFASLDEAIAVRAAGPRLPLSEPAARRIVERGTKAVDGGFVWSSDPRLMLTSAIRLTEDQILACLPGIACPTLMIMADPPMPYVDQAQMAARIAAVKGLEHVVLPGTHHLHLEDPQPAANAIAAFRARHRAA